MAKLNEKLTIEKALRRGLVPVETVIPSLKQLTAETLRDDFGEPRTTNHELVAAIIGCDGRTVGRCLNGEKEYVSFDIADKILCRAGRQQDWITDWAHYYYEVRLK